MKTWAGEAAHDLEYIRRSIPSLLASDLPAGAELLVYDDCSPNPEVRRLLEEVARRDDRVRLVFGDVNRGPNWGQEFIYRQVEADYPDAPYYVNVDDDVVYHRDWLTRLVDAWQVLGGLGIHGIHTALDMPFRRAEAAVRVAGRRYHLKWKQPALNWFIPREVYAAVGPFVDEGIAYDTVYSHWMRLRGYPVIAMTPSYVQNIGLLGAYADDDTTTSRDFLGEGEGDGLPRRLGRALRYTVNRIPDRVRGWTDTAPARYGPIRWGTDFVFDGRAADGAERALFAPLEGLGAAQGQARVLARVAEVRAAQGPEAFALLGPHFDRHGTLKWVESEWRFTPNLREARGLGPGAGGLDPRRLLQALAHQVAPLHARNVVHNKIRLDNVYVTAEGPGPRVRLAWLGTEPLPAMLAGGGTGDSVAALSGALNRWARPETRERFAAGFLEAIAPEIGDGAAPSPASDVYAMAAVVALSQDAPPITLGALAERRDRWTAGRFPDALLADPALADLLATCLQPDPARRPATAATVLQRLAA